MLAQNFLSAKQLGLSDEELAAHVTVLGMLERGELKHDPTYGTPGDCFNMGVSAIKNECGTVACFGGWVGFVMGLNVEEAAIYVDTAVDAQQRLYYPGRSSLLSGEISYEDITPAQTARAARNYLTQGEPLWEEVLA